MPFWRALRNNDASDIAKVIDQRTRPSYEERLAVFKATGRSEPSREPFFQPPTARVKI